MSATQTPEVARSDVYTDAEALLSAAQQIAALRAALQRMSAHAAYMSGRAVGHPSLEQGFIEQAAMAEEALEAA